jgi:serine/threonine protein kinase
LLARKIVRVFGAITRVDIENEGRLISSFLENGGHENIVAVTSHGWIRDFYFIDMELCDLTLHDYIAYFDASGLLAPPFEIIPQLSPVFVEKKCSPTLKIQNILTIGTHIARGLEFMHGKGQVHRDLKPRNGKTPDIY